MLSVNCVPRLLVNCIFRLFGRHWHINRIESDLNARVDCPALAFVPKDGLSLGGGPASGRLRGSSGLLGYFLDFGLLLPIADKDTAVEGGRLLERAFPLHPTATIITIMYILKSPGPAVDLPEVALHEGVGVAQDLPQAQLLGVGVAPALPHPRVDHLALFRTGLDPGQHYGPVQLLQFCFVA